MRQVTPGIDVVTSQGYDLIKAGDLPRARAVLEDGFSGIDFDGAEITPAVVEAASLYARVLLACGEVHGAADWAAYAHELAHELFGHADPRTVRDAATLAAALQRSGDLARAEGLYRDVIARLSTRDGPDAHQTLAARADLATVLHARGECRGARAELAEALARHQATYGPGEPAGIRMLARLAAMARDCGDAAGAARHFTQARALSREYLPANHPIAAQVALLGSARANAAHTCGFAPTVRPREDDPEWWPPESDASESPTGRAGPWAQPEPQAVPRPRAEPGPWTAPPPDAWSPRQPDPRPAPEPDPPPAREPDGWQPTATAAPADRALIPRQAEAAARLPVPRELPVPRPSRRRRWLTIVIALLLAALGLAAGWVATTQLLGGDAAGPASTPTPGPSPTGSGGGTTIGPTDVALRDARTSITLTWTYPSGAEGPVMVSGGRSGQEQRAFQTLPAGTETYTLHGLADGSHYCFTVAVVYATDLVARAAPVCTAREKRGSS
jgi:hypothetical protein